MEQFTPHITPENVASTLETAQILISEIITRLATAKANKNKQDTIIQLNNIINDLIDNQNSLIQNQLILNNKLESQTISPEDISYISNNIVPIIQRIDSNKNISSNSLQQITALLSPELLKIMQLVGFNIKEAIGIPATKALQNLISNAANSSESDYKQQEFNVQQLKFQTELLKIVQDDDKYQRYLSLINR